MTADKFDQELHWPGHLAEELWQASKQLTEVSY
jgi:hypothetical protein